MSSPEQRPANPQARLPEPVPFPAVVQDEQHTIKTRKDEKGTLYIQAERGETVLFSAALTPDNRVRLLFDAGGNHQTPVEPTPLSTEPAPQESTETTLPSEQKEKEEPVLLRGRIATDIRRSPSPTGGEMARFQFAEHPNRSLLSYWNAEPESERPQLKNNTAYRTVGAFDDNVALLEGAEKGQEYDLTCFKRSWQEPGTNGKNKTVQGFYLLGLQKVTRRAKPQPSTEQKPT